VYGPTQDAEKEGFLQEIREVQSGVGGPWMINGNFNMIYQATDKSNDRLHRRQMGRFRRLLSDLELKQLHLHGRLFTWSNERTHPTLERIDHIFISLDWEDLYPNSFLQSMYSACSDHAPLLLQSNTLLQAKKRFHCWINWALGHLVSINLKN
jgi:exonuclease III